MRYMSLQGKLDNLSEYDLPLYLTFDDVLILPNFTNLKYNEIKLSTNLTKEIKLRLPIIASPMDTVCGDKMALGMGENGGMGIIHRNQPIDLQASQVRRLIKKNIKVGAAVGLGYDFKDRSKKLVEVGVKLLCVDYSMGYSQLVYDAIRFLKKNYNVEIMAGNVATYEGAKYLLEAGADVLRVGKGAGSICISRKVSGVGVPQISAIFETAKAAKEYGKSIVADGGIRSSGDIVKALAAGADAVMLGVLISGTDEAPGTLKKIKNKFYKYYRGMGSMAAMKAGSADRYGHSKIENINKLNEEGIESYVEYKGKLEKVITELTGGINSGFMNVGAKNITKLRENSKFIRVTNAGNIESFYHNVIKK